MIRNRFDRLGKAMLATLVAVGLAFAMGCQSSPDEADDPIPTEPTQEPAQDGYDDPYGEEAPPPAEPAEPGAAPGEPMAPDHGADLPASAEDVTEDQVQSFAEAYVTVMDIRMAYEPQFEAATDAEEMAGLQEEAEVEIVQAVETHDITVEEFNAIADLLAYDEGLRQRIQSHVDSIAN